MASNDSIVLISRAYPDFDLHHFGISLYFSNVPFTNASMVSSITPCDLTLNIKNTSFDINAPCIGHMNHPTSQKYHGNMESSVTSWYRHHHIKTIVDQFGDIYIVFNYQGIFSPIYKLAARPYIYRLRYISMHTLFKKELSSELETWFSYYALLGVEHFIMYYNGDRKCIDPRNCNCPPSNNSCGPCLKMSCFMQQLANLHISNITAEENIYPAPLGGSTPLHPILHNVSFEFVGWDYIYEHRIPKNRALKGQKHNFQNAQPQAIASGLYYMKHLTSWLMFFDTDEYALPIGGKYRHLGHHSYETLYTFCL